MRLSELARDIGTVQGPAGDDVVIGGVTDDSRQVRPGWLFIARRGTKTDGGAFVTQALAAGAAAVLTDHEIGALPAGTPVVRVADAAAAMAEVAERFHGYPSRALRLVGVTGTNGKSTIVHLASRALDRLGVRCGTIGTIDSFDGGARTRSALTTPPATELSGLLARMVAHGCRAAVMETSSHALHQRRTGALAFDVGVFTNLTGDHLDYHRDMDDYAEAKALLFAQLPTDGLAIIHRGAAYAERMAAACRCEVVWCGPAEAASVRVLSFGLGGQRLGLKGPWGEAEVRTGLIGEYNAMNTLQAAAVVQRVSGCDATALAEAFEGATGPEGRLDAAHRDGDRVRVFVDFAHTDDALANSIDALRAAMDAEASGGRLWVVFGAGGDRDPTKRPRMGRAVADRADEVVVTSDNPRTEAPGSIIEQVLSGMESAVRARAVVEADRAAAIGLAIRRAGPEDVVLIAGKGHERYQILPDGRGGVRTIDFDDAACARRVLDETAATGARPA